MSLPIHLQSIKSSGVYRFVYDKSVISNQVEETLRLLVGYSDKGPFNTPVYISTSEEFINTYGNISKRLEKKGIFFHRLALQALTAGPILCLNLKNFTDEQNLGWAAFDAKDIYGISPESSRRKVTDVYNTNRFWTVSAEEQASASDKYFVLTTTDTKEAACSLIVRKAVPEQYALTIRDYYNSVSDEMPEYLMPIADNQLNDYFMDVYVFKGQFTPALCGEGKPLSAYFDISGDHVYLKEDYVNAFGEPADALEALANDPNSGYVSGYQGTTIPFFKNANGSYISLDILFNADYNLHKMLMNMNEDLLADAADASALNDYIKPPYLDAAESDMDNNVITYMKKEVDYDYYQKTETSGTYSYTKITSPTDEQKAAAVEKPSVPSDVTASSEDIIKVALDTYSYVILTDPTAAEKKQANKNEYTSIPDATADSPVYIKVITLTTPNIEPLYLTGFTNNTDLSAASVLGVITGDYGKGLQEALTNRVDVEYHYLVDTFDTSVENDKTTLAALARKKDNCFAILNFPSINKNYSKGITYKTNNTIDFAKVVKVFNLPSDTNGASWCGYFTQIVLSDGTVKSIVPSAGLVSNQFVYKWTSRQPYYIVAGSQYGTLTGDGLVGPDYAFSRTDRDILEPFGINTIVYEPRRGTYVNSEQTAKQVPVSALSKIHIRELVIYLQNEIADLLESYRWELNTQVLRDKIKARADVICETVRCNGGLYDYLNICDDTNNTPETIDNEFLVLDTHIEPARGCGRMVERLYIYRTGEMRSAILQA